MLKIEFSSLCVQNVRNAEGRNAVAVILMISGIFSKVKIPTNSCVTSTEIFFLRFTHSLLQSENIVKS